MQRVLAADSWWGLSALLWLGSGLPRLLLGTEKGTSYYLHSRLFWVKMALFLCILILELGAMRDLLRWRRVSADQVPDTSRAARWATVSAVEAALVVAIVFVATALARGY